MKALNFLLVALVFCCLSCDSDDGDDTVITSDDLSGTWVSTGATFDGTADVPVETEIFNVNFTGQSVDSDHRLIFSDTSDLYASEGSYDVEFTFSLFGISQSETVEDIEFLGAGTWSRSGNNLTLTIDGEATVFEITTLTDTELVIKSSALGNLVEDEDFSFQDLEAVFSFERQ